MASAMIGFYRNVQLSDDPGAGPETRYLFGEPGVLSVCGEVDHSSVEGLRRCLHVLALDPSPTVAVDLAGVTFISCAGLTPLLEARSRLGQRLHLRAVSPAADRLLRLTKLTEHFGPSAPLGAARQ